MPRGMRSPAPPLGLRAKCGELAVVRVFGAVARQLLGFVPQEVGVGALLGLAVSHYLRGAGPEHEGKEVGRHFAQDRVRLRQGARGLAGRQLDQSDVIARVDVEWAELGV